MAFFWACFVYSIEMKQSGKGTVQTVPLLFAEIIRIRRWEDILESTSDHNPCKSADCAHRPRGNRVNKIRFVFAHGFIDKSISYDLRLRISGKLQVYCIVKGNWAAMRVNCFFELWENSIRIVSSMAMWSEYVPSNVLYSRAENILVLWNIAYWISVKPYFSTIIARSFACSSLYTTRASRFRLWNL